MKQVYWTEYELDCIRKYYPEHGAVFVDEIIFRKYGRRRGRRNVMQKAMLMGVRFVGEHRTRFRPGIVPANTGKKPSAQTMEKLQRTFFPKGHLPHNTRPKGDDVSVRWKDGSPETNKLLVESMAEMIRDLKEAKTPEEIKNTSRKAQAMTGMVNAFVGVAKLEIETIKITRKK